MEKLKAAVAGSDNHDFAYGLYDATRIDVVVIRRPEALRNLARRTA